FPPLDSPWTTSGRSSSAHWVATGGSRESLAAGCRGPLASGRADLGHRRGMPGTGGLRDRIVREVPDHARHNAGVRCDAPCPRAPRLCDETSLTIPDITMRPFLARVIALAVVALEPVAAQRIDLQARAAFYADNTEFFTPYRTGETIFGAQLGAWLLAHSGANVSLRAGALIDRRWGSEEFVDSIKPILAVAWRGERSTGILGTLDSERRHRLIDPVMVSTRELTTPVEYGLQWRERRGPLDGEVWLNWRKLNTPEQREEFEMGAVAEVELSPWLETRAQDLWSHRGGQLHEAGVPVSNNRVTALGVRLHDSLSFVGRSSVSVMRLWSTGHLDPDYPADRPG